VIRKSLLATAAAIVAVVVPAMGGMDGLIMRDMDGNRVYVDSLLAEGPVVINFWATWCGPCRVEMPKLQKVQAELEGEKVHFAAISLDARRSKSRIEAYVRDNGISLPVYRDPEGTLAKKFKVMAIPTTILLDQDAEIAYKTRGYRPGDEILLKKEIEALIERRDKDAGEEASPQ
jgi:thiol-disulfide isomerase/thioredoxin